MLQSLNEVVKQGWLEERSQLKPELYPYFQIRDEITVQDGLLFKNNRVLVLASQRLDVMKRIHSGHHSIKPVYAELVIMCTGQG